MYKAYQYHNDPARSAWIDLLRWGAENPLAAAGAVGSVASGVGKAADYMMGGTPDAITSEPSASSSATVD